MKTALFRIFVLVALVTIGSAATIQALPSVEHDTVFYADDTRSDIVGEVAKLCSGARYTWGIETDWFDTTSDSCEAPTGSCYRVGTTSDFVSCYFTIDTCSGNAPYSGACPF
jgi:hypothetical protein